MKREHRYYTYIVASRSHTLYVGITNNIEARMEEHRNGVFEGFSKRYHCNRLVYLESWHYVQRAIAREKEIKGWLRAKKIALIESQNPTWADLSENWGKPIKLYAWPEK